jgi:hypothetical protein
VGSASYTIGTGGIFNTVRPLRIVDAFIRDSNGFDYPVDVTMTRHEYDAISDKTASARPTRLYYDPQYALGIIYFDYAPDIVETLYLVSEKSITELANTDTTVSLPDYYKMALIFNLAILLAADLDNRLASEVIQIAAISKNTLENMVALDRLMRTSKMDVAITYSLER